MESPEFSLLSSLRGEFQSEDYVLPHYKESYRLAIDRLVTGGRDSYQEFLKEERTGSFLSEEELRFIAETAAQPPPPQHHEEDVDGPSGSQASSGTYWPMHSDVDTPNLDLGWPEVMHERLQTNIDLLFHPPRQNSPTIKEVIRKNIQEARQVVAIVMDVFTDVDIFKEAVDASLRAVPVYVLLDYFHLQSFLTMAQNQDVKIQQLRNMRVRAVRGQDYLCRSGARFHGAMGQKFLLVDCHTAIYGSYSFTWSFEKINMSMVQVITGHLVKSYDEEFRTLYARSSVPAELSPAEGISQRNGPHALQILPNSHCAQRIERRDHLRHTLDTVYRKTCEGKLSLRNLEERLIEEEPKLLGPLIENGMDAQSQMPQFQPTEAINYSKRHSYAGERHDGCLPQNIRPRASNWNISKETGSGTNNYPMDNYLPRMNRGQHFRQSYSGIDRPVLSTQQNTPTLENASKSCMRTMRIESYLKNPDVPFDSCEYLDQFEPLDKAGSFMQGRMRSSLVFRSTIPEQVEPNRHMNSSSIGVSASAAPNTPLHYSSMQWSSTAGPEPRMSNEEFLLKRKSLQILDDRRNSTSYDPGINSYHSLYASLGRAKGGHKITSPDIVTDSWHKRHSVADPRSNTENVHDYSSHMYGAFARIQINRSTAGINALNGGYTPNLSEDQRSISHYDVKSIAGSKNLTTPNWQEPPSRAVSAAILDVNCKDLTAKSNSASSQHFLKKSSKKLKSLLNIPERKEDSLGTVGTPSLNSGASTDTLRAVGEEEVSDRGKAHQRAGSPVRFTSEQIRQEDSYLRCSQPRFRSEEHRHPPQISQHRTNAPQKPTAPGKTVRPSLGMEGSSKDPRAEYRLYSRYEPFCSLDKKHSLCSADSFGNTRHHQDKPRGLPKGEAAAENNPTHVARGSHENKLEKFFQRVGNLIHKNKQ